VNEIPNRAHLLPALGRPLAFRETPPGTGPDHPTVRRVHRAVAAVVELDQTMSAIDPTASPQRRAELLRQPFESTQLHVAAVRKTVDAERDAADQLAHFLDVPKPAETVAQTMQDVELRQWFRAIDEAQARPLWQQMGEGQQGPLLDALGRFTVPDPSAVRARELFATLQRQKFPQKAAELESTQERAAWAAGVADAIGRVLDHAADTLGPVVLVRAA
jgi:hypothetical protein